MEDAEIRAEVQSAIQPKKKSHKWLILVGAGLVIAIAGLVIWIMTLNNRSSSPATTTESAVSDIISEYQFLIDSTDDKDEKADYYLRLAYELSQYMQENDSDQCGLIQNGIEQAKALSDKDYINDVASSLLNVCIHNDNDIMQVFVSGGDDE